MTSQVSPELEAYRPEFFTHPNGELLAVRFDVNSLLESHLGQDWQIETQRIVDAHGVIVPRTVDDPTCREADPTTRIGLVTVEGGLLAREAPGLWNLYSGTFKQMMQQALPVGAEPLRSYEHPELGLECVTQFPPQPDDTFERRLEAHVDGRYTAVLVLCPPVSDQEGRLVIGRNPEAQSLEEIRDDAEYITHRQGTLLCFSRGSEYPHFTEPITVSGSRRTVISLNYPKESETPEQTWAIYQHAMGQLAKEEL